MTKRQSEKWLSKVREMSFRFVEVLPAGLSTDCDQCQAIKGKLIPIDECPTLPLPECKSRPCKCVLITAYPDFPGPRQECPIKFDIRVTCVTSNRRSPLQPTASASEVEKETGSDPFSGVFVWLIAALLIGTVFMLIFAK